MRPRGRSRLRETQHNAAQCDATRRNAAQWCATIHNTQHNTGRHADTRSKQVPHHATTHTMGMSTSELVSPWWHKRDLTASMYSSSNGVPCIQTTRRVRAPRHIAAWCAAVSRACVTHTHLQHPRQARNASYIHNWRVQVGVGGNCFRVVLMPRRKVLLNVGADVAVVWRHNLCASHTPHGATVQQGTPACPLLANQPRTQHKARPQTDPRRPNPHIRTRTRPNPHIRTRTRTRTHAHAHTHTHTWAPFAQYTLNPLSWRGLCDAVTMTPATQPKDCTANGCCSEPHTTMVHNTNEHRSAR